MRVGAEGVQASITLAFPALRLGQMGPMPEARGTISNMNCLHPADGLAQAN